VADYSGASIAERWPQNGDADALATSVGYGRAVCQDTAGTSGPSFQILRPQHARKRPRSRMDVSILAQDFDFDTKLLVGWSGELSFQERLKQRREFDAIVDGAVARTGRFRCGILCAADGKRGAASCANRLFVVAQLGEGSFR